MGRSGAGSSGTGSGGTGSGMAGSSGTGSGIAGSSAAGSGGAGNSGAGSGGASADVPFFDPVSPDHIATAFMVARQQAQTLFASSNVAFLEVQGIPTGPGETYATTPWRWEYTFSACDASAQPCANTKFFSVIQPGWSITAPVWQTTGEQLSEGDFAATVPLSFLDLLAQIRIDASFCPVWPIVNSASFIRLQGGVKSGSGKALWWWTFACNNQNPSNHYYKTNGDVIAGP